MTVSFRVVTELDVPPERACAISLDIGAHETSMAGSGERAVAGTTSGTIGLGESVTWRARHLGIVWRMTSRITAMEDGHRFVDEQVRGPFARFRHEHRFEPSARGTRMVDEITFRAPLGRHRVGGRIERWRCVLSTLHARFDLPSRASWDRTRTGRA